MTVKNFPVAIPKTIFFLLVILLGYRSGAQTIVTIAGDGIEGYSGDGWAATAATLNFPFGVAVDTGGNVYIADHFNNCIRKVNPLGMIMTIAGTGTAGYSGDGGPAINAELDWPTGVALDRAGNLYIADESNDCIRKVDSAGAISTIAGIGVYGYSGDGGPATAAALYYPWGVAIDTGGNVYIADQFNQVIRRVDTAGIISTIAGNGTNGYSGDGGPATAAQLYYPVGVATDKCGNLYIADKENNCIRKVCPSGTISTFAGTGSGGYNGDGRIAISAEINGPTGVAVDSGGNVYIADAVNNRICVVTPAGIIRTIAGTGPSGYSVDGTVATAAQLDDPEGVAVDCVGNVYIADASNFIVREVTPAEEINTPPFFMTVFPNPNQGEFTIVLTAPADENAQVVIVNALGQKVTGFSMTANKELNVQIRVPRGVYFLTAIAGGQKYTAKIVVA